MDYRVFLVIYKTDHARLECVAVSAADERSAERRLKGDRPAKIIASWPIANRSPEWAQERIEGTCDMREPLALPPEAGSKKAEEVRESNHTILERLGAGSGWRAQ